MTQENLDKIEQEAREYAKQVWNANYLGDDFIHTRKGMRSYEDYYAGRLKSDKEKEKALKEIRKGYKQLYDEYTSVNVRLAEKEKEIDELEFWKEQNDIAHVELKSNYLKVYDELKSKEKEIAELKEEVAGLKQHISRLKMFE